MHKKMGDSWENWEGWNACLMLWATCDHSSSFLVTNRVLGENCRIIITIDERKTQTAKKVKYPTMSTATPETEIIVSFPNTSIVAKVEKCVAWHLIGEDLELCIIRVKVATVITPAKNCSAHSDASARTYCISCITSNHCKVIGIRRNTDAPSKTSRGPNLEETIWIKLFKIN